MHYILHEAHISILRVVDDFKDQGIWKTAAALGRLHRSDPPKWTSSMLSLGYGNPQSSQSACPFIGWYWGFPFYIIMEVFYMLSLPSDWSPLGKAFYVVSHYFQRCLCLCRCRCRFWLPRVQLCCKLFLSTLYTMRVFQFYNFWDQTFSWMRSRELITSL